MRSSLLLGSMYFWSLFIELKRSYKYNGIIACTGISTFNGHISEPVALREKLMEINCIFFILGFGRWFCNFPLAFFSIFDSYAAIFGHFLGVKGVTLCHIFIQI